VRAFIRSVRTGGKLDFEIAIPHLPSSSVPVDLIQLCTKYAGDPKAAVTKWRVRWAEISVPLSSRSTHWGALGSNTKDTPLKSTTSSACAYSAF